jgi:hypothetical protein
VIAFVTGFVLVTGHAAAQPTLTGELLAGPLIVTRLNCGPSGEIYDLGFLTRGAAAGPYPGEYVEGSGAGAIARPVR